MFLWVCCECFALVLCNAMVTLIVRWYGWIWRTRCFLCFSRLFEPIVSQGFIFLCIFTIGFHSGYTVKGWHDRTITDDSQLPICVLLFVMTMLVRFWRPLCIFISSILNMLCCILFSCGVQSLLNQLSLACVGWLAVGWLHVQISVCLK